VHQDHALEALPGLAIEGGYLLLPALAALVGVDRQSLALEFLMNALRLPDGATVQQAIQAAGGLVPGAQLDKMQLRRNGKVIPFDYKRYLDTGDAALIPKRVKYRRI